ncbi:MAG: M14 family zinc carboxypeptidase [Brevundimonas sp.]
MPSSFRGLRALLVAAALCLTPAVGQAQTEYYFPDAQASDFDPAIPTPEAFLGYPIGSRYTRHDRLVDYLRTLDSLSDRVSLKEVGQSYEGRPLVALFVTAPANQARLDDIQDERATIIEPGAPALDPTRSPVVVGLYYSVHGNETSSGEAALLTAYYLAANRSPRVAAWLDEAVVLIDPAQNPDGRDRSANWHNAWSANTLVADPADRDHNQSFPGGRGNHYFTDLNRDWLAVTQQETRAKLALFHQWRPNVQIDFHEMGPNSTYYFEPSPSSMHSPLLPQASYDFNVVLARYHAQALDGLGSLYYTREIFDNFSPVYGSTYPDFHGGVGVTVEQASSRGLIQETDNGPLEFRFTIRNQLQVGLATVRGAVTEHAGLFDLQASFFRSAREQGARHRHTAFVFGDEANQGLTRQLLDLLLVHNIVVHALAAPVTVDGRSFTPGSAYVVPSAQPQFRLVHSIFEETPETRGGVYGSTSYAIVHAYDIRTGRLSRRPSLGERVSTLPEAAGGVIGSTGGYAYVVDWRDLNAPRLLSTLLAQDVRVRVAFSPFTGRTTSGEVGFERGALVIPTAGQSVTADVLHAAVDEAAREAGVAAHTLVSGQSVTGVDLGSEQIRPVEKPEIALVMGDGVNAAEIGSAWFALSERLGWPATRLEPSQLGSASLDRYTSIVLAGGRYDDWSDDRVQALKRWVQSGGSLVTFGTASRWALAKGLVPTPEGANRVEDASAPERLDFADRQDFLGERRSSGNLVSADVDVSHPLAFGVPDRDLFVNKETDVVLPAVSDPFSNVVRIDETPLVNGYLSEELRDRLSGAVWSQAIRVGRGNVVLFADDPAHRKYWLGTERLLVNALFFAGHLTPTSRAF